MKRFLNAAFLVLFFSTIGKAESFKSPDILIDSKLDNNFSEVLVEKFRLLFKNYKIQDPFSNKISRPIEINHSELGKSLSYESQDLLMGFGNSIGLNLIKTETKVSIEGFAYDIKGFKTELKASEKLVDGVVISTDISASEITMSADRVSLQLVIPGKTQSPLFKVNLVRPRIVATEDNLINFFTKIKIQDNLDHYKFKIEKANFDQMANSLKTNPDSIQLEYEDLEIPNVSLRIGRKEIRFSPEKIQEVLKDNHEAIKELLLVKLAKTLESNTASSALKAIDKYRIEKEFWINTSKINSQFLISEFTGQMNGGALQVNLPGDFCTTKMFLQLNKNCTKNKITKTAESRLNKKMHMNSIQKMRDLIDHDDANFVASVSEDYVNKLLVTTYDAGLWKTALDAAKVELGPNRVILRLDKEGESATLIMDVLYHPGSMEKVLTGSREIRFPLVLDVAVRIEKKDGVPVVIIRLNDVDTSDETLINGRPNDGIVSTVKDVKRFKSKVAKAIREKVSVLRNKDIIELPYPDFKDVGLEKIEFFSDGNGRMNAVMRLEDLLVEN